jgi:hypothetical protein
VERDDGVTPIIRPAEQLGQLGLGHLLGDRRDFPGRFAERFFILLVFGDIEKKPCLCKIGVMFFPAVENVSEAGLFFENGLGFVGVVPKIGLRGDLVQLGDTLLLGVDVKAASATVRAALRGG